MMRRLHRDFRLILLLMAILVVGGIAGFATRLAREDPTSQVRWGYVTTRLPGAEPSEVEAMVSEPMERLIREVGSVASIESSSLRGVSLVFIRLSDEVDDVSEPWLRVQDKLTEVREWLPAEASVPTLIHERRWGAHSRIIGLHAGPEGDVPVSVLSRWAKELNNRLSFVPGTRFTEVFGLPTEEIVVELDEERIASARITAHEVGERIRNRDSQRLDAVSNTSEHAIPVSLAGDINSLDRLRDLIVRSDSADRQLRLGDIATIRREEHHPRTQSAFLQDRRAVVIATRMEDSYGIDAWTRQQQKVLDAFASELPAELQIADLFSQKTYTDKRATSLYQSLLSGMLLVIVVVCLMMGWRAAIPICAALPLSLGLVFFLMMPFGISLHQISIAGLILALGMLIDNPIIVVDLIQRELDNGRTMDEAIDHSVRRIRTPLIGSNVTTMLGFVPILLIGGPTGEFMEQLAWSVITCLAASLLLSLTIVPAISGWILRPQTGGLNEEATLRDHRPATPPPQGKLGWVDCSYLRLLRLGLRFPVLPLTLSVALPAIGFVVAGSLPEQFFPVAERDHFHFSLRLSPHAPLEQTESVARRAREMVMAHPEVQEVAVFVGTSAPKLHYSMVAMEDNRSNFAQAIVQLSTESVSPELVRQVQRELDAELPEAQAVVTMIEQGPPAPAPIELRIYGPSLTQLDEIGREIQAWLMQVPGVVHTRSSLDAGGPSFAISVNQSEAESSGLTDEMISHQIRDGLEGSVAAYLSEDIEEVPIRVRLARTSENELERVLSLPLITPGSDTKVVSVGSVAKWTVDPQLFSIHRRNSTRCNVLSVYVEAGALPISVEKKIQAMLAERDFRLPLGYRYDFGGISAERSTAVREIYLYAAVTFLMMAAVLVMTFGSFRLAGIIFAVGCLSVGIGLACLWLFGYPIGIVAIIGLAGMTGLAINDSIVVLTECKAQDRDLESIDQAVFESTRHVLTTSVTTVAGVMPLILAGGVFWPPMMIVIAGGITGATLLALGFTPACFAVLTGRRR